MLFGEYLLLLGGNALAMPFHLKGGQWALHESKTFHAKQQSLQAFSASKNLSDIQGMDIAAFQRDVQAGLYFESSIPTGYGLGSSGALCAAVYDTYCAHPKENLLDIQADLAQMESFFHGNSSGLDPLTSYTDAVLFLKNGKLQKQKDSYKNIGNYALFLIDTELPRSTSPLVAWFKNELQNADFQYFIKKEITPLNNQAIKSLLENDAHSFYENIEALSAYQLAFFQKLIPLPYQSAWQRGLQSKDFYMKLCGAGGGGYLLVWVRDGSRALLPKQWKTIPID